MAQEQDKDLENVEAVTEAASTDVSSIFEGEDLSEEFKTKASVVFEAAVKEAVDAQVAEIQEEAEADLAAQLTEAKEAHYNELTESLSGYLDEVIKEWLEQNRIAVESGIKVEMAESFITGLKGLFYENNIELDEETVDVVAELENDLAEQSERNNAVIHENLELKRELDILRADVVFNCVSEGLTETQKDRLRTLSENIDASDIEGYTSKLRTIKEAFVEKEQKIVNESVVNDEDVILNEDVTAPTAPATSVDRYIDFINNNREA